MMGSSLYPDRLWISLVWILTILLTADGSSITWYEPPPIQTLLDSFSDPVGHLANSTQLLEGSINASLSWNFSLSSDLSFSSLTVSLGGTVIAGVALSGPGVQAGFKDKFDIRWIPFQRVTLIIFNVTTEVNGTFRCTVAAAKGFGTVNFESNIQVHVVDPPSNIVTSSNITVTAPANLTLNCSADGRPKPTPIWTRLSDNKVVPMPLNIIGEQDAGGYRCTAANGVGSALTKDVFITVLVPPEVDYLTSDWDECENATLILRCNATGKPTPNITWRRVASDGTVIEKLPALNGVYVLNNTNRNSSGQYRCTASNGVGIANKTVNVTVRFAASVDRIINSSNTVNEGGYFNMTCQASENPLRTNYTWINKEGPLFNESVLSFIDIRRAEAGQYRCEVENRCGMDGRNTTVIVYYPPNITSISLNQTVVEGDVVLLDCIADGNPQPKITWTRLSDNSTVSIPLTITGKQDEGGYRCTADNGIGNAAFSDVFITIQYPPNITFISDNQMVNESDVVQLDCIADGNPQPKITWTRLSDNSTVSMPLTITGKQDEGGYRCTADNGVENATFSDVFISVQSYSPINVVFSTNLSKDTVDLNDIFNLTCSADANPAAKYRLYRDQANLVNITDGQSSGTFLTSVNNRVKQVTYRCIPFNSFRDGPTKTINVTVYYPTETTGVGENYTVTEGSMELSCPVDGNPDPGVTWYKGREATGPEFASGKLLKVTQSGCYTCSASNDLGTPVSITHCLTLNFVAGKPTSAMPTSTGQPIKEGPPWTIIGAVAGSVVLVAFVVALVTWWVHKKRKCIKDTKIHNSECEESLHGYSPHASVNRAYAESGPPSANGSKGAAQEQSQDPGAIPTYAVVDKSKKKKKAEEKPPIYATVDKSKKRKKKRDDKNLYDSVEEPKKEKKPGEVTYAELGDFQKPAMPKVSTSPETLPPLKRAPSYEQTQYADITAFLKGDATLPQKEGNEGSEMQQQQSANQSQHDVDNKETPIQEESPCSRVNGAYAKSGPPSANSTDVSSAAQKQPAQEAGAIPTYEVVDKSKKKKKEPDEMPLVNIDMGKSKKKKKKTDDKNLYDSVEEPKKEKKPGEIFYADLGEFQKQEMPKVATSPPTLPPLKRAPSYEKTDYAEITEFLRKEATLPKVATSPPTLPPIKGAPCYEKTDNAEITQFLKKEATLPREKSSNSEMKPQAANQTHDEVENKETAL